MRKMVNGLYVELTEEEIDAFDARESAHTTKMLERAKVQYRLDRAAAYPSVEDQLDKIYRDGLEAWKLDVKAVKDAYPKPGA